MDVAAQVIPMDTFATEVEVTQALARLTRAELLRLSGFARYRMRALGSNARGRTHDDLMSEAVTATLAGSRRWNKQAVDLFGHLCGVMRSVSSHWREEAGRVETPWPETYGDQAVPVDMPSDDIDAPRRLIAAEELARIRAHFADDGRVTAVLADFEEGLKGPEIKARHGLTQVEYETILKRLRRGAARLQRMTETEETV
jgi:RNA polymerase sigma-70 factor (ECF subfamily)